MQINSIAGLAVLVAVLAGAQARDLQQDVSSASAVSVSGGQGPYGNCGATSTSGNAAAYASGPPCSAVVIPAPPPSSSCPATTVTVDWHLPAPRQGYRTLTLCTGSSVGFKWNTGSPTLEYGLYQIPNATCPLNFTLDPSVKLIISPASSPNVAGIVTATLNAPSTYYFADPVNCLKGQLQTVVISGTVGTAPPPGAVADQLQTKLKKPFRGGSLGSEDAVNKAFAQPQG